MKKVLSFVLALVMVMALSVTAFGANTATIGDKTSLNKDTDKTDFNIEAAYSTKANETVNTYKVKIDWKTPSFSYEKNGKIYTWNTTELKYVETDSQGAGWNGVTEGALSLKVTNYSDKAVTCSASLEDIAGDGITVTSNKATENWKGTADAVVDSTKPTDYLGDDPARTGKECDLSATITVDGAPNNTASKIIANVTVTVAAA